MSIAYIQSRPDGELLNVNCYSAWHGFTELGYDVRKFSRDQLGGLELSRDTIVHGNIGPVWAAWDLIGVARPPYINVPTSLMGFTGRAMWETTLGDVRRLDRVPLFIKPLAEGKGFTGHVVREFRDLLKTSHLPDDYPLLAQEPVTMLSEWRVYVLRQEIVGAGHYKGEPLLFPDSKRINAALEAYTDPVIAHSMDFAIRDDGTTILVELNDAYGLGNYSLPPVRYARMIEARWREVCGNV